MKKILVLGITFLMLLSVSTVYAKTVDLDGNIIVKNKLFALSIPLKYKGIYDVKIKKDTIMIFDKESKNAGFGGFAFGIRAYKNPADHAVLPGSKKIGELTDKRGTLYDMVLKYPTDVQYDYTKSSKAPEAFKSLYELGNIIDIKGVKGANYYKEQGTKGADLYNDILKKHKIAIKEKWDSIKLEQENMSYMYNLTRKVGYIYYDLNADGIDELLVGEISDGAWKGVIYDIYTMVNRKPQHVVSGGARNRYFVCDGTFLCNEYSSGAGESGLRIYNLVENSTEIFPQVAFKYDSYSNPKNPWFITYGNSLNKDDWENVSEKIFKERKQVFDSYLRFDYIPINGVK